LTASGLEGYILRQTEGKEKFTEEVKPKRKKKNQKQPKRGCGTL